MLKLNVFIIGLVIGISGIVYGANKWQQNNEEFYAQEPSPAAEIILLSMKQNINEWELAEIYRVCNAKRRVLITQDDFGGICIRDAISNQHLTIFNLRDRYYIGDELPALRHKLQMRNISGTK